MYQCIIIDDDPMARKSLERLCARHEDIQVAGIFESAPDALAFLEENAYSIDLLFLDVEMPEMSGIEFLNQAPSIEVVIFTTANSNYAFDAFEHRATDFLKKPISPARFEGALAKALEQLKPKSQTSATGTSTSANCDIFVREDGRYIRIPCDEILFFENVGDYVRVKTKSGQHLIYGTLKGIAEKLSDSRFLKVHRSYIVNLQKIKDIDETTIVIEKNVIPVSRAHRNDLMSRLNLL